MHTAWPQLTVSDLNELLGRRALRAAVACRILKQSIAMLGCDILTLIALLRWRLPFPQVTEHPAHGDLKRLTVQFIALDPTTRRYRKAPADRHHLCPPMVYRSEPVVPQLNITS